MGQGAESLSIVIPLHNEAGTVDQLMDRLERTLILLGRQSEIVLVDDGSRDATLESAKEWMSGSIPLKVVALGRNYGQTAALAAGIESSQGDWVITMDGDLQHRPEEIPRLLSRMGDGVDIVSGRRLIRTDSFWTRQIPSLLANWLARRLTGVGVIDFGSTFKVYRGDLLREIDMVGDMHRFLPILLARRGANVVEVPITVDVRTAGVSHYSLRRVYGVFGDILFLGFFTRFLTQPLRLFLLPSLLLLAGGLCSASYVMLRYVVGLVDKVSEHQALLLLSVFLMTLGVHILLTGMLAEMMSRTYFAARGERSYKVRARFGKGLSNDEASGSL